MESDFPELKTKRLLLRQPVPSDAAGYHELLCMDEVTQLTNIPASPTEKRSQRFVGWMEKLSIRGTGCGWVICTRRNNQLIGGIRINEIHRKAGFAEIGYELHPAHWGRGLMTEAVAAVTTYGHESLKLNRMEAWVIPGNIGSEAVLKKNGYQYEGTLRQRLLLRGEHKDVKMYGRLRAD